MYYVDITMFAFVFLFSLIFMILGFIDRLFFIVALMLDMIFGIYIESSAGFSNQLFCTTSICNNIPLYPYDYMFLGLTIANVFLLIVRLR
jgi:hypothetical protein